ncbi:hypothetical protein H6F88_09730 [Oculatella sp. FACHB-28]|nr:hypothetical protein [Oculatella sp. FACHB-28]
MRSKRQASSQLEPINVNAAGIDIGSQTHWVCVPAERAVENVRSFGAFTADLYALADWLQACQYFSVKAEVDRLQAVLPTSAPPLCNCENSP